ncbi:SDR family NAD(P)-dependent oxidoreductase [Terriglobus roseus]|uniref:SDR family NAD(P)-dependent oxidoreductase n=1 Tax=Terriglobus roseus TaxID=392734 RepID=UPI0009F7254B
MNTHRDSNRRHCFSGGNNVRCCLIKRSSPSLASINDSGCAIGAQRAFERWAPAESGKAVFISSIVGLVSVQPAVAYPVSERVLQSIPEAMDEELKPLGIQVQTINPSSFLPTSTKAWWKLACADSTMM